MSVDMSMELNRAIFNIVDTLDITLEKDGDKLTGHGEKVVSYGALQLKFPIRVSQDFITKTTVGVLIHLKKNLWCYMYGGGSGKPVPLWAVMFDGGDKNFATIRKGSAVKFLEFVDAKAAFIFKADEWYPVDPATLPL